MICRHRALRFLVPALLLAVFLGPAQASQPVPVGPGTSQLSVYQPQGPWAIHVLTVDVADRNLRIESLLGGGGAQLGRQGVTKMLAGSASDWHTPIAAVNADFFAGTGHNAVTIPLGFHVENGELVTFPDAYRTAFFLTKEGRVGLERFHANAWLSGPNNLLYPITVMNRSPEAAQVALFTPRFGAEARAEFTTTQVVLTDTVGPFTPDGQVTGKVSYVGIGDRIGIPPNGAVLAANGVAGYALKDLKVGDQLTLKLAIEPKVGEIVQAIGGGPRLVRDGVVSVEHRQESFADSFATRRHPRTGIGLRGSELLLVTVDGRQPGYSDGMTLTEFAQLFVQLGCQQALNLDGGGSTTMVVRGQIVNSPSDGGERHVANALALFSLAPPLAPGAPPRPVARLVIEPQEANLLSGESLKLTLTGLDEYVEPTPVEASQVQWEVSAGVATVTPDGTLTAGAVTTPAAGLVTATLGRISASAVVSVTPSPARLTITPAQATLPPGAKQRFTLRAYDANGAPLQVSPDRVAWNCDAPGALDARGLFRAPQGEGAFAITATVGQTSAKAEVLVGATSRVMADFEKETPVTFLSTPPGTPGSVAVVDDPLLKGNSCAKLRYDFSTTSGTRAAHAVLNLPLPETRAISLRVLGDGQGEWLRPESAMLPTTSSSSISPVASTGRSSGSR